MGPSLGLLAMVGLVGEDHGLWIEEMGEMLLSPRKRHTYGGGMCRR